jgi:hypothetical protein
MFGLWHQGLQDPGQLGEKSPLFFLFSTGEAGTRVSLANFNKAATPTGAIRQQIIMMRPTSRILITLEGKDAYVYKAKIKAKSAGSTVEESFSNIDQYLDSLSDTKGKKSA